MRFSLIICTYLRPKVLLKLLGSVNLQTLYPNEILIVDGSINDDTKLELETHKFKNLKYFKVEDRYRGLTKQRNYGISLVSKTTEIICFLDDDTVLRPDYFEVLLSTYDKKLDALAVGGYVTNEVVWEQSEGKNDKSKFYFDDFIRNEPSRFKIRRFLGLLPDVAPGFMPSFSHGRSVSFLPPTGKIYQVEQLMGGVSSFKREVFETLKFSPYFEGYGLYEDADFSLRIAKRGFLYINTGAQLEHHHDVSGRPDQFSYGKMVLRNGWYVWRVKYPSPNLKSRLKWNATALMLTIIRFTNVFNRNPKKSSEAFTETIGRIVGWFSLIFNKPKVES
ncbi:glycosyltransferase family 2 protein [Seonamhaeicola sp. ML3]|uniref:glycosyltransferase family 2 protein n=1 Tax=Seonamhaeicola sp. ML3 TaxID=2937786 RepID=UPI00200DE3AE|nr:glycosyltransferase [Seonamhaeicola sp. ML3]